MAQRANVFSFKYEDLAKLQLWAHVLLQLQLLEGGDSRDTGVSGRDGRALGFADCLPSSSFSERP